MNAFVESIINKYNCSDILVSQLNSISFLYDYIEKQRCIIKSDLDVYDLNSIGKKEKNEIIINLRNISAEVYSCCDIINCLFISLYREDRRYRGTSLANSFNENFKKIYNANMKKGILKGVHTDADLNLFYYKAAEWYVMLHDIRTQETHYEMGRIKTDNGKLKYFNNNRNGVSKTLYTNPSKEIYLEIKEILALIDKFLEGKKKLCEIIILSIK